MEARLHDGPGSRRRLRQAAPAAGSGRDRRLRQPRRRPAAVHRTRRRSSSRRSGRRPPADRPRCHNAIYIALKDLKKVVATNADEVRRQAIVVLSDGEDTSSLLPFEEVLDLAKRSETAIYSHRPRIGRARPRRPRLQGSGVRPAAVRAGNRRAGVLPGHSSASWTSIYGQISDELSSQYTVGYTSRNPRATAPGAAWSFGSNRARTPSPGPSRDTSHQAPLRPR